MMFIENKKLNAKQLNT